MILNIIFLPTAFLGFVEYHRVFFQAICFLFLDLSLKSASTDW